MAGPKPDDPYAPNNRVAVDTKMPYDTLATRATGEDFGAAKGRGLARAGTAIEGAGKDYFNYQLQQQGLANEYAANAAEQRLIIEGGDIYNKYKNLEGLAASNSKDQYVSAYTDLSNKIRETLPSDDARRSYDQLATRRLSFTVQDMNSYAAGQKKSAYKTGNQASAKLSIDRLSSPSVASSDQQSDFEVGNAIHQLNTEFTAPEYGDFNTLPVKMGINGKLEFDTKTDDGRVAQDTYDYRFQQMMDSAWTNRIHAVATDPDGKDNINRAVKMLEINKAGMSVATSAKLARELDGPYRTGKARALADTELSVSERGYQDSFNEAPVKGMTAKGNLDPYDRPVLNNKDGTFSTTSSKSFDFGNGEVLIPTVVDGKRLSDQEAIDHYKKTGENFGTFESPEAADEYATNLHNSQAEDPKFKISTLFPGIKLTSAFRTPEHNAKVGGVPDSQHLKNQAADFVLPEGTSFDTFKKQLDLAGIKTTELLHEDIGTKNEHVHVAWGDKSKDAGVPGATRYTSKAEYYRANYDVILDSVRAKAEKEFGDPTLVDQTVAYTQTKINQVIHGEELQTRADRDSILDYIRGDSNKGVQVINTDQLYNAPKPIRDAWTRFQTDNPDGANRLEKGLLVANAEGQSQYYGSNFWKNYLDMASGRVKDVTKFDVAGGKTSAFTNTGFQELYKRSKDWQSPEGHTWQTAETKYLSDLQRQYTGSGLVPGITKEFASPEFNQVLKEVLPKIAAGKKEGKTAAQLFSPTINGKPNPDYVTASPLPPSIKIVTERRGMLAMFNNGEIPTVTSSDQPQVASNTPAPKRQNSPNYDPKKKYASREEFDKDMSLMTREEYVRRGVELGFFSDNVPRPQ